MKGITLTFDPTFGIYCTGGRCITEQESFTDILSGEAVGKGLNFAHKGTFPAAPAENKEAVSPPQ